jgi:hypothetical protein
MLAVVHANDPRLGPAVQARVFDFEAAEFASLRAFLEQM